MADKASQRSIMNGLEQLAAREPDIAKDAHALGHRAERELEKLTWAVPAWDEEEALAILAHHGFSHRDAVIARLRSQLPEGVSAGHLCLHRAFRNALKAYKAGKLEPHDLERFALVDLRQGL